MKAEVKKEVEVTLSLSENEFFYLLESLGRNNSNSFINEEDGRKASRLYYEFDEFAKANKLRRY